MYKPRGLAAGFAGSEQSLLTAELLFGDLDQTANHVAADRSHVAGGLVPVISLIQRNPELLRHFEFHLLQCGAGFLHDQLVSRT